MKRSIKKKPRTRCTKKEVEIRLQRILQLKKIMSIPKIAEFVGIDRTIVIYYLKK